MGDGACAPVEDEFIPPNRFPIRFIKFGPLLEEGAPVDVLLFLLLDEF